MRPRVLLASFASTAMTATGGVAAATSAGAFAAEIPTDGPPLTVVRQRVVVDPAVAPAGGAPVAAPATVTVDLSSTTTSTTTTVVLPGTAAVAGGAATGVAGTAVTTAPSATTTTPGRPAPPVPTAGSGGGSTATTAAPRTTTTTTPRTTTTTWPPGTEIPDDWSGPIPPIPPGCRKPHLEDDGRWNCEH